MTENLLGQDLFRKRGWPLILPFFHTFPQIILLFLLGCLLGRRLGRERGRKHSDLDVCWRPLLLHHRHHHHRIWTHCAKDLGGNQRNPIMSDTVSLFKAFLTKKIVILNYFLPRIKQFSTTQELLFSDLVENSAVLCIPNLTNVFLNLTLFWVFLDFIIIFIIIIISLFSTGWQNCDNLLCNSWNPSHRALLVQYWGCNGECIQVSSVQATVVLVRFPASLVFGRESGLGNLATFIESCESLFLRLSTLTAKMSRFTYWKICCYVYVKKTKKRRKRMLNRQRAWVGFPILHQLLGL